MAAKKKSTPAKEATKKTAKKKVVVKKTTHLVIWDSECGDPVKAFTSVEDAKTFVIDELLNLNGNKKIWDDSTDDIKKESIKIYEVKGTIGKVEVTIKF